MNFSAADVVAKTVDPFFTTKPVGEGTGLGLSMIYGFARQTRGHLRIYSEVGHGTTVKLYLPRALQDAVVLEKPAKESPRGQGETILVVEDDATVRLERLGGISKCGDGYIRGLMIHGARAISRERRAQATTIGARRP